MSSIAGPLYEGDDYAKSEHEVDDYAQPARSTWSDEALYRQGMLPIFIPEVFEECFTTELQIQWLYKQVSEGATGDVSALLRRIEEVESAMAGNTATVDEIQDEVAALYAAIEDGGLVGPEGPPGPEGPRGPEGPAGPAGADGEPGPPGADGAPGPEGPEGPKGPKGDKGDPGPAGADGEPGPPGEDGAPGPEGPRGPKGPQGDPGPRGPEGPEGPKGEDGTGVSILGDLPSEDELPPSGAPGDAWLISGNLWVWSDESSQWTNAGSIQGPEGPRGPEGPAGPAGADGEPGPPGEDGATGPEGPRGPKGEPGADGEPGPEGPKGETGPRGPAGADGEPGPPGEDGAAGPEGPPGPKGDRGLKGEPGADGEPGPRGPEGPEGPAGPAGPGLTNIQKYNLDVPSASRKDVVAFVDDNNRGIVLVALRVPLSTEMVDTEIGKFAPTSPSPLDKYAFAPPMTNGIILGASSDGDIAVLRRRYDMAIIVEKVTKSSYYEFYYTSYSQ